MPTTPPRAARPRPSFLRALGRQEPPSEVTIDGVAYAHCETFKHDSWAATALYAAADGTRAICKFNRQASVGGLPLAWLGHWLARRERYFLAALADSPLVPNLLPPVEVAGRVAPHAVARRYVPGHPLGHKERVGDRFFPELLVLLADLHRRELAYVDLHKRENVIVGDDGRPYLIDFQISHARTLRRGALARWSRAWLRLLQECDRYHAHKLLAKSRPDQLRHLTGAQEVMRPVCIDWHRGIAVPFRRWRRALLVALGVRAAGGRVESEHFAEHALRPTSR